MGRNSVKPSTIPMMMIFTARRISMQSAGKVSGEATVAAMAAARLWPSVPPSVSMSLATRQDHTFP
jgi:hypothetical protein